MIDLLWRDALYAALISIPVAALFFYGLAWSIQRSLSAKNPAALLLLSFAARAAALLLFAYGLIQFYHPFSALFGFSCTFLLARFVSVALTKRGIPHAPHP